mgnify:CR=1 FL=1
MTAIEALAEGYLGLGLEAEGHLFAGETPAKAPQARTVLAAGAGSAHATLPVETLPVRVNVYDPDARTAHERARAAYEALHQRGEWHLTGWRVLGIGAVQPPWAAPAGDEQGKRVYRVVFDMRVVMVRDA